MQTFQATKCNLADDLLNTQVLEGPLGQHTHQAAQSWGRREGKRGLPPPSLNTTLNTSKRGTERLYRARDHSQEFLRGSEERAEAQA